MTFEAAFCWIAAFASHKLALHAHATAHTAHAAGHRCLVLFRNLGHHCFSREHETGDRSRVLQRSARYFRWIDDTGFYQGLEFFGLSVKAEAVVFVSADAFDYHCAL